MSHAFQTDQVYCYSRADDSKRQLSVGAVHQVYRSAKGQPEEQQSPDEVRFGNPLMLHVVSDIPSE